MKANNKFAAVAVALALCFGSGQTASANPLQFLVHAAKAVGPKLAGLFKHSSKVAPHVTAAGAGGYLATHPAWAGTLHHLGETVRHDAHRAPEMLRDMFYGQVAWEGGQYVYDNLVEQHVPGDVEQTRERLSEIEEAIGDSHPQSTSVIQRLKSEISDTTTKQQFEKLLRDASDELDERWIPHPTLPGVVKSTNPKNSTLRAAEGFEWLNDDAKDYRVVSKTITE